MNEELQSTNEELETINDELRDRTGELNQVNEFLEAILTSLGHRRRGRSIASSACRSGTTARRTCGACAQDEAVDHHFLSLDIGLPSEQLAARAARGARRRERARGTRARGGQPPRTHDRLSRRRPAAALRAPPTARSSRGAIVLMEDGLPSDQEMATGPTAST